MGESGCRDVDVGTGREPSKDGTANDRRIKASECFLSWILNYSIPLLRIEVAGVT